MSKSALPVLSTLAVTALLGGLVLASPAFAEGQNTARSPLSLQNENPSAAQDQQSTQAYRHATQVSEKRSAGAQNEGDVAARIETRIQNLHDKLKITPEQEGAWKDVAQAMRDNEISMSAAIQERHQNAQSMNAIEDLQSYQKIAQSHADGLKNVVANFASLYDTMSDSQKKNADGVFDHYEGRGAMHKAAMKKGSSKGSSSDESAE